MSTAKAKMMKQYFSGCLIALDKCGGIGCGKGGGGWVKSIEDVGLQSSVSVEMRDSICEAAFNPTYETSADCGLSQL